MAASTSPRLRQPCGGRSGAAKPRRPPTPRVGTQPAALVTAVDAEALAFQHSIFCQTGLPYRNPGPEVREWERVNGGAHLMVLAGTALDPAKNQWVRLGLPYGPKPRLILIHLSTEAIRTGSPVVEVGNSVTAFAGRLQGRPPTGPELRLFKDQLAALAAATIRLGFARSQEHATTINTQIVQGFDVWLPKDQRQRVMWPSTLRLSHEFFTSLQDHAVPLDERAVAALAHSALALDIYCWLAQRLHRIPAEKPQFISWSALCDQFGQGYGELRFFRRDFLKLLTQVRAVYPAAQISEEKRGLSLEQSHPPVAKRVHVLSTSMGSH
jgi:hypothetical protein